MAAIIQLIVGLNNPGAEHEHTRHNAGAWLVEALAASGNENFRKESKFFGLSSKVLIKQEECRLLLPNTFMNLSGRAVQAMAAFYQIPPENILVVHDDLDLPPGVARLKQGGGDGGHNGLKSITQLLGTNNYWRLRIGIGHPGDRHRVHDYVLSKPTRAERKAMDEIIEKALGLLPRFILGERNKIIQMLHTTSQNPIDR